MENYKMTAVDVEAGMEDVYRTTVENVKHSRNWMWKTVVAVAFIVLCGVASLLFVWHFTSRGQSELVTDMKSTTTTANHQQMLSQIAKSTKAAIHLHASKNDDKPLQWVSDVDQSFSTGGLKLENNTIVIPSNGLYFVYSQASFEVSCVNDVDDQVVLSHNIVWSSLASPSTDKPNYLLNGFKSVCHANAKGQNDDTVYDAIYLGAVFSLYKGDRLSTDTIRVQNIEDQSSKTFFGVFAL